MRRLVDVAFLAVGTLFGLCIAITYASVHRYGD